MYISIIYYSVHRNGSSAPTKMSFVPHRKPKLVGKRREVDVRVDEGNLFQSKMYSS